MKLEPKVPTHARKRCPKDFSKKPTTLGDRAIRSSKVPLRPLRARELQIQDFPGVSGGEESLPSKIYEILMLGRVESPLGREWESREERGRRLW